MIEDRTVAGEQVTSLDHRAADRLAIRIVRNGGGWIRILLIASLVLTTAQTALPAVLGQTMDAVLQGSDSVWWLLGCGLLIGVLLICDVLDDLAAGMTIARSTAQLRRTMLDHILALV